MTITSHSCSSLGSKCYCCFLTQQPSFGIMAMILDEAEGGSENTAHSAEQPGTADWDSYLEKRNVVLQFLHSNLSLRHLQQHQNKVELLKKSCFYLEVEPKHVNVRDQNHVMLRTDILQLVDPCQFQRMKKVAKDQTEIQLTLLTELLEQLKCGREELNYYLRNYDIKTFLSQWNLIVQRLTQLSTFLENLLSLQAPGKLYVKHHLVSHANLRGTRLPNIRLSICTKMPLIFDRNESYAYKDWAKLKWFTENQESHLEQCELHIKLLTNGSQNEPGYGRIQPVTSDTCAVSGLQPGRSYEFAIRRSNTHTFVSGKWYDRIVLTTKTDADEDGDGNARALEE